MQNGLIYILQSLMDLYLMAFVLRLAMQWVRADFRNPIVKFVLTVTNPLVLPLRRFIPPLYKIDTATVLVFLLLQLAATGILAQLSCAVTPDLLTLLGPRAAAEIYSAYRGARLVAAFPAAFARSDYAHALWPGATTRRAIPVPIRCNTLTEVKPEKTPYRIIDLTTGSYMALESAGKKEEDFRGS